MEKIKVTDAAAELGSAPAELVARLGKLGVKKTAKGSISPEEFENVKKSEASVEVVRKDVNKDVIVRRRSKPAAAPAAAEPAAEEKPASPEVAEVKAAPVEAKAEPAVEKAPKAAKPAEEAKAEKPRRARVVEPKATPAARIVTPKAEPKAAVVAEAPKAAPAAKVVAAPAEAKAVVKAEAPKAERRTSAAFTAEPEGSSQPSLLPPVQERRREEKPEAAEAKAAPAENAAPRVRVISRPDPTQARIVRPAAPGEGRPSRDGEGRGRDERGGNRDIWMAAYNAEISTAFWMGFDNPDSKHRLASWVSGGDYTAALATQFFKSAYSGFYGVVFSFAHAIFSNINHLKLNSSFFEIAFCFFSIEAF